MNVFEFDDTFATISGLFPNFYNPQRKNMIQEIVKDMHVKDFARMALMFCETQRQPPTPQDFRKAIAQFRSRSSYQEPPPNIHAGCFSCNDFGYGLARTHFGDLLIRCSCHWGDDSDQRLPRWRDVKRDDWQVTRYDTSWMIPKVKDLAHPNTQEIMRRWREVLKDSIDGWKRILQ